MVKSLISRYIITNSTREPGRNGTSPLVASTHGRERFDTAACGSGRDHGRRRERASGDRARAGTRGSSGRVGRRCIRYENRGGFAKLQGSTKGSNCSCRYQPPKSIVWPNFETKIHNLLGERIGIHQLGLAKPRDLFMFSHKNRV